MDNNDLVALNETAVDNIMLDVIEYSNKIKIIFNKIDDLVEQLKAEYVCSSATIFYKQYEELNDNYSVIVNNILSYNNDLMSLKKRYVSTLGDLTQQIKSETVLLEASNTGGYKEER